MTLEEKLNKVLGLEGAGQSTKEAGQATTGATLGATTGSHPRDKKKRNRSDKKRIKDPET